MVAAERDDSKLGWTALGACLGALALSPFAVIVGLWASVFAGTAQSGSMPTEETAALGLPYGVLIALGLMGLGAVVGAIAGRAFAVRPRPPQRG